MQVFETHNNASGAAHGRFLDTSTKFVTSCALDIVKMPNILKPKLLPATSPQFVLALQSPLYQAAHASTIRLSNEETASQPTTTSGRMKYVGLPLRTGGGELQMDKCGTRRAPTGPVRGMRGALANKTYTRDLARNGLESGWVNVLISMEPPDAPQIHNVPVEVKEVPETNMKMKEETEDETPLPLERAKKQAKRREVVEEEPSSPGHANKRPRIESPTGTQLPEVYISEQLREAVEKAQICTDPNGSDDFAPRSRNERHVRFLNCISLVLQESSGFFKRSAESGSFQPSYDELRTFQRNAKRLLDEVEQGVHMFRVKEMQRIDAEKIKAETAAAAERSNLLYKIEILKQENATVRTECTKLGMEVERLSQEKGEAEKKRLEAEEDKRKLLEKQTIELDKKHDEEIHALGREFVALQGKGICQMCFRNPRDGLILPCLHLLYCYQCLDKYKSQSNECPWASCRGRMNALLLCNLTGDSGPA